MATTDYYDNRIVSTVDAAAVTLFTAPTSYGPSGVRLLYDFEAAITWIGGSVTAGLYVASWITGGATFSATISAAGFKAAAAGYGYTTGVISPDLNTAVTVQVTTLTGTATILVKSVFSRML